MKKGLYMVRASVALSDQNLLVDVWGQLLVIQGKTALRQGINPFRPVERFQRQ